MKLSDKRKRYYTMIWVYEKRINDYRKLYGLHSEIFKEKRIILDRKIKIWKQGIRRIDKLTEKIHNIEKAVVSFTGVKIIGMVHTPKGKSKKEVRDSKLLYYKFGLENGIRGKELREYIGVPKTIFNQPYAYRKEFTNSFVDNPENRQKWVQFKLFYENLYKVA